MAAVTTALPDESRCTTVGRFWEEFKQALGDQARGSMKYGASTSVGHNAAAMRAARAEREAQREQDKQDARKRQRSLLGHVAQRAVLKATSVQQGRDLQYVDDDFKVEVKSGYDRWHKAIVTDILIFDRLGPKGARWHIIIDEMGTILHQGWKTNE